MRVLFSLFLCFLLCACSSLAHRIDDLEALHSQEENRLSHRFHVERYSAFGAWLRFGSIGRMLGSARYSQKASQDLEDPAEFCAERVHDLGKLSPSNVNERVEAAVWANRILHQDPYVISRIQAGESLLALGDQIISIDSSTKAWKKDGPEYKERVKALAEQILLLERLSQSGKATPEEEKKIQAAVEEIATVQYERAEEALILAKFLTPFSGRAHTRGAIGILLARALPQALMEGLEDPNEFVRESSLTALYQCMGKRIFPQVLTKLSAETSPLLRRRLAQYCGDFTLAEIQKLGLPNLLEFLANAVRDSEGSVAVNAMLALSRICQMEPNYEREYWRAWWEEHLLKGNRS